ncbi:hypothetical protein NWFMUON74_03120 [Nocardia wallacei]|uniref:Uncharacterized protein n=1 Tax=Nocardia wallacei TaxID=480035 RepID=A0A7G1KCD3_9NOCA|nr:hypothetical protein NWFMUON74_03120 [Nocardia wallacei]
MRLRRNRVQHRDPRGGDPQADRAQSFARIEFTGVHDFSFHLFWNKSRKGSGAGSPTPRRSRGDTEISPCDGGCRYSL